MVDAHRRTIWGLSTAPILAVIAEVNRDPKARARPFGPADFPFPGDAKPRRPAASPTEEDRQLLRLVFPGG